MARRPLNVLVLPFRCGSGDLVEYAIFRRADDHTEFWQGVAGGVEDTEEPLEAARRELLEETGIDASAERWIPVDAKASVPAQVFRDWRTWGPKVFVVNEHAFGVDVAGCDVVRLSHEHVEHRWLGLEAASRLLRHDSNRTALWELNERLGRLGSARSA
jgi:dATP pyrophosphohydrolase